MVAAAGAGLEATVSLEIWLVGGATAAGAALTGAGAARVVVTGLGLARLLDGTTAVALPSAATSGMPSRAAIGSYSFPSKFASKNFLNHWTNSKLSWNLPFTSFSTGMILTTNRISSLISFRVYYHLVFIERIVLYNLKSWLFIAIFKFDFSIFFATVNKAYFKVLFLIIHNIRFRIYSESGLLKFILNKTILCFIKSTLWKYILLCLIKTHF